MGMACNSLLTVCSFVSARCQLGQALPHASFQHMLNAWSTWGSVVTLQVMVLDILHDNSSCVVAYVVPVNVNSVAYKHTLARRWATVGRRSTENGAHQVLLRRHVEADRRLEARGRRILWKLESERLKHRREEDEQLHLSKTLPRAAARAYRHRHST